MPLITKQGYLKRPQYERILVKLEILRDNGQFNEHEHLVTSLLQRCANGNKPDLQLALKIGDRKESKRARVCLPHLYNQTKTKRVMYLIQIF